MNRLIETLTNKCILTKRYGTLQSDEALTVAKSVEEEAYGVAAVLGGDDDDDGIEILQAYSKEISKRVLDSVNTRTVASPTLTADNGAELAADVKLDC